MINSKSNKGDDTKSSIPKNQTEEKELEDV